MGFAEKDRVPVALAGLSQIMFVEWTIRIDVLLPLEQPPRRRRPVDVQIREKVVLVG